MRESFLHFLWRTRRFDQRDLATTEGQDIDIQHVGEYNADAGPDFFNARLRLGGTLWAGNVEMHVFSSEWAAHGHSSDPSYDNVVLHVVLEEDTPVLKPNGERIPCLELRGRIPEHLLLHYEQIAQERSEVPCHAFLSRVPSIVQLNWLDRLLVERLERKTAVIAQALEATENHWEEAFYRAMARNFGLKVNADPFEALARSLPLNLLAKHKSSLLQLEALLFGQAGMLGVPFHDAWPKDLAREYRHLAHKYGLSPLAPDQWKFLRMRPANFPTVRIAQFAALAHQSSHLFSKVIEAGSVRELENLFTAQTSDYWNDHFQFDKPSVGRAKTLGRDFVQLIVINTVVPFLFHYGKTKKEGRFQRKALELLEELPTESNSLLDAWAASGISAQYAYQGQALLELKTQYCDSRRCLDCAIGNAILK
jgi:hypothetical protein